MWKVRTGSILMSIEAWHNEQFYSQIYDQLPPNVPLEGYSKKNCRLTHIRGRRSTLIWHPPPWWLKLMKGLRGDFPCRRAWKKSRKLLRWKISGHSRILAIPNKRLWHNRNILTSSRRCGTSDRRPEGAWIKWVFTCEVLISLTMSSFQSLSRQSSLAEDRINSSDEDEFLEERSGGTYSVFKSNSFAVRPNSFPQARACQKDTLIKHSTASLSFDSNQPDLIKEVLAQSMKTSQTESDLKRFETKAFKSASFDGPSSESFCSFRSKKFRSRFLRSDSFTKVNEDSKIKKKRKKDFLSRSCISQWKALECHEITFHNDKKSFLYNLSFNVFCTTYQHHHHHHTPSLDTFNPLITLINNSYT